MYPSPFDKLILQARAHSRDQDTDALIFLGNPTDPVPQALIQDTDLPPWARLVWCYLRACSRQPGAPGQGVSYDEIRTHLGIGSRSTVADALQALRITRWITQLPTAGGKQERNIYVLHELPPSLEDIVKMDPKYPKRLRTAAYGPKGPNRTLAQQVMDGVLMTEPDDSPLLARYSILASWGWGRKDIAAVYSVFQRASGASPDQESEVHLPRDESIAQQLDWYEEILGLTSAMREVAETKLLRLPEEWRQPYLDELAAAVLERKETSDPIRRPTGYLVWMIQHYQRQGEHPLTGRGERLQELQRKQEQARRQQEKAPLLKSLREAMQEKEGIESFIRQMVRYGREPTAEVHRSLERIRSRIQEMQAQPGIADLMVQATG